MTKIANQNNAIGLGIWAMAAGNFAAGMSSLVIAGVLTDISADLGVSVGTAGQPLSSLADFLFRVRLGCQLAPISASRLAGVLPLSQSFLSH